MSVEVSRESVEVRRKSASYISSAIYSTYARPDSGHLSAEGAKAEVKKMLTLDDPPHIKI